MVLLESIKYLKIFGDFPGGPVVKNLPSNAGDVSSTRQETKIPHASGQQSPSAATETEAAK